MSRPLGVERPLRGKNETPDSDYVRNPFLRTCRAFPPSHNRFAHVESRRLACWLAVLALRAAGSSPAEVLLKTRLMYSLETPKGGVKGQPGSRSGAQGEARAPNG